MVNYSIVESCEDDLNWTVFSSSYILVPSEFFKHQELEHSIRISYPASGPNEELPDDGYSRPYFFNQGTWPVNRKVWGFYFFVDTVILPTFEGHFRLTDPDTDSFVEWYFDSPGLGLDYIVKGIASGTIGSSTVDLSTLQVWNWYWLEVDWQDPNTVIFRINGDNLNTFAVGVDFDTSLEAEWSVPAGATTSQPCIDFLVAANETQYPPDVPGAYDPISTTERFGIQIYRQNDLIYDEPFQDKNLITMEVHRNLNDEDTAKIRLDNEELLDIRAGDVLKISISTSSTIDTKIFNGEITEAVKAREEGEAFLDISAKGWGKILKENEITLSFPEVTNASTICKEIVSSVTDPDPLDYEHLITVDDVETTSKTRTIDFEGLQMYDALKKLGEATAFDFYVDPDKDLNWFARGSRDSGSTLDVEELQDYDYEKRREICNWAKVYGAPIRTYPDPWELDSLTEELTGWSVQAYYDDDPGSIMASTIELSSSFKKDGDYSIYFRITSLEGETDQQVMIVTFALPETIDLSLKESFTALKFATMMYSIPTSGDNARRKSFEVFLIDEDSNTIVFPAGDKNLNWWQGDFIKDSGTSTVVFQEFDIPVGPAEEGEGQWVKLNESFNWDAIVSIQFKYVVTTRGDTSPDILYGYLDWLHFARGRWTGNYKLDDANTFVVTYGRSYAEFYDESAYTTEDCYIQAKYLVEKYKQPIDYLENVEVDYQGMEFLDPGEKVYFELPEGTFNMRITNITWIWDGDLYGKLDLDSDPW